MPTVDEMLTETKKRDAAKRKLASKAKTVKVKNPNTDTETNKKTTQTRRPVVGIRAQIENFWLVQKLKARAPETYATVVKAVNIWQKDGEFEKLDIPQPIVKKAVVETLTRAKNAEKFVLKQPIVQRFLEQAQTLLHRFT